MLFVCQVPGVIFTLQRKSHLCIPFLGIARPKPQFPQKSVEFGKQAEDELHKQS